MPKKNSKEIKNFSLNNLREGLFTNSSIAGNPLQVCLEYSIELENFIRHTCAHKKLKFAIASGGSFARRELSPYSDIDLLFIIEKEDDCAEDISELLKYFWDSGIEISQVTRDVSDIEKFFNEDLHSFTQFFETRFIAGNHKKYNEWQNQFLQFLNIENYKTLAIQFLHDAEMRYKKFGFSPKEVEPNTKNSNGGLRDIQLVEWLHFLESRIVIDRQAESTQIENFMTALRNDKFVSSDEIDRIFSGYNFILKVRHLLHMQHKRKVDRLEADDQIKIAKLLHYPKGDFLPFMKDYLAATNVISRFTKSYLKRVRKNLIGYLPDVLTEQLDDEFFQKGGRINTLLNETLTISQILRAFYFRGIKNFSFDENLRSMIIESIQKLQPQEIFISSVFFREILRLDGNVGETLASMHELGVLGAYIKEFGELTSFIQHGVYHTYTADEHTLMTIKNIEKLRDDKTILGKIFNSLKKEKEILFLALLFHDIAKPNSVAGHEILGAETASSVMSRLGYADDEINDVCFLVRNHLLMEQVAFRRNLNDPETLNIFCSKFSSSPQLDLLYLLTYADLSAVNPALWTSWKHELLNELYRKAKEMLDQKISGEEMLIASASILPQDISKHSDRISDAHVQTHIEAMTDISYASHFSEKEIARHIEEIIEGEPVSVLFKELENFTNITVISKDYPALLSRMCGALLINDANILDAKIFTRKDGIVIDNFNVTDFRTNEQLEKERYEKIKSDFIAVITGRMQLGNEITKLKSKWWRIENKFFKRPGQVKIKFEDHEKYTIIDVFSPDRLGLLYKITSELNELGLNIYFAKIATRGDEVADAFYVLDRQMKKASPNFLKLIESHLIEAIEQIV